MTLGVADLWEQPEATVTTPAPQPPATQSLPAPELGLRDAVTTYERELVNASLARHHGSWAAAARELQIDRANLQRLAKRLDIARP